MSTSRFVLSVAVLVVVSSCGSEADSFSSDDTVSAPTSQAAATSSAPEPHPHPTDRPAIAASGSDAPDSERETLYSTSASVIETPEHGPEIAFQLLDSYPPQGGGLPLSNWSWQEAPDVESASGTSWGGPYRLVGAWDGATFTLTQPATSSAEEPFERVDDALTPDCVEDDFLPVLDLLDTLDREALGIIGSGEDVWDGRCGATVEAYFDTVQLREALEPQADRITAFFYFTPLE